jgi:hypothetical protein
MPIRHADVRRCRSDDKSPGADHVAAVPALCGNFHDERVEVFVLDSRYNLHAMQMTRNNSRRGINDRETL